MGTWAAGPFGNDQALDYLTRLVDTLTCTVIDFLERRALDRTFDEAFAAVAIFNVIAEQTLAPTPNSAEAKYWRDAFLECFDREADEHNATRSFRRLRRQSLENEFEHFIARCRRLEGDAQVMPVGRVSRLVFRAGQRGLAGANAAGHRELGAWARTYGDSFAQAWTHCPRGDWLLVLGAVAGLPQRVLVPPAAAWVATVLPAVPADETRPARAVQCAGAWARGEAGAFDCARAAVECEAAAAGLDGHAASAARAAGLLAASAEKSGGDREAEGAELLVRAVCEAALAEQLQTGAAARARGVPEYEAMVTLGQKARDAALGRGAALVREGVPAAERARAFEWGAGAVAAAAAAASAGGAGGSKGGAGGPK